ncbi:recombinase family protein [Arthrobacter sp. TMS2-4]
MRHLGCTRVGASAQDSKLQFDALLAAGFHKRGVLADVTSGSRAAVDRPGMKQLLEYADEGDTVVVGRVDRLGGSLSRRKAPSTWQGLAKHYMTWTLEAR